VDGERLEVKRRHQKRGARLADKSLRRTGQRLMAWAVANARVEPKGNATIVTKQRQDRRKTTR